MTPDKTVGMWMSEARESYSPFSGARFDEVQLCTIGERLVIKVSPGLLTLLVADTG